jgi:hypothetical protein
MPPVGGAAEGGPFAVSVLPMGAPPAGPRLPPREYPTPPAAASPASGSPSAESAAAQPAASSATAESEVIQGAAMRRVGLMGVLGGQGPPE